MPRAGALGVALSPRGELMPGLFLALLLPAFAASKLTVTATTTDLGSIITAVAKDRVELQTIVRGTQDPHHIEAKPSFMAKMRSTELVVAHGLELEAAWLVPLIAGSRNPKLQDQKNGVLELAGALDPIEVAQGPTSRADGDVHPGGNPHFQLDPIRLGDAAGLIARRLGEISPTDKEFFAQNAQSFRDRLAKKTVEWQERVKKTGVKELITYHKSLSYFCARFGIRCDLQLEPKPGVPPTTSHLMDVASQAKARNIKFVLIENLFSDAAGEKIRNSVPGLVVKRIPISVEGEPEVTDGEKLIERIVRVIEGKD